MITKGTRWEGHALAQAVPISVDLAFRVKYWNRTSKTFEDAYDTVNTVGIPVELTDEDGIIIYTGTTDEFGVTDVQTGTVVPRGRKLELSVDLSAINDGMPPPYQTLIETIRIRREAQMPFDLEMRKLIGDEYLPYMKETYPDDYSITHRLYAHISSWKKFEKNYSNLNFNIAFEGDSWFHYPVKLYRDDLSTKLVDIFDASNQSSDVNALELQHFGDEADVIFDLSSQNYLFLQKWIGQYRFDLVILSAGGNDVANPGVSDKSGDWPEHWRENFETHTIEDANGRDVFNPYDAKEAADLDPSLQPLLDEIEQAMESSFVSLLRHHLWYRYLKGDDRTAAETALLDSDNKLNPPGVLQGFYDTAIQSFGFQPTDTIALQDILNNWPSDSRFPEEPDPSGQACDLDEALKAFFDLDKVVDLFSDIQLGIENALDLFQVCGVTKVVGHSYGYPLVNEKPTRLIQSSASTRITGPWLHHRLRQAGLHSDDFRDELSRAMVLRSLMDGFERTVLQQLVVDYSGFFSYVDLRQIIKPDDWRDEMHLKPDAYEKCAQEMFVAIDALFPGQFN